MDFINFALNFLVDEMSGDSEYVDSVWFAAGEVVALARRDGPECWWLLGQRGPLDDGEDRESVVDAGSEDVDENSEVEGGGEEGRCPEVGEMGRVDGGDFGEKLDCSLRWWEAPDGKQAEVAPEYMDEGRGTSAAAAPAADHLLVNVDEEEANKERDRRFWETCLASGYP